MGMASVWMEAEADAPAFAVVHEDVASVQVPVRPALHVKVREALEHTDIFLEYNAK